MKKRFVLVIAILSIFLVVGCGKKDIISGTWVGKTDGMNVSLTFKKGNFTYKNDYTKVEGKYTVKDDKVTISCKSWEKDKIYDIKLKNGKLSLTANDMFSPNYKNLEKK